MTATTCYLADVVVVGDEAGTVHRPGYVEVTGDRISAVGSGRPMNPDVVTIELGGLVMPGLINTHAHSSMTLLRSVGDGLSLEAWLSDAVWPREALLTADDAALGMAVGAAEMLSHGITTTSEMYLFGDAVANAVLASGMRSVVAPGIFDLPGGTSAQTWEATLDDATDLFDRLDGAQGRLTIALGPHSTVLLPDEALRAIAEISAERGCLVHIHLGETATEAVLLERDGRATAVDLIERAGLLEGRLLVAHAVYLDDVDIDRFASARVGIAHNPASNAKLASGIAPIARYFERGITVGLGTDGPASNDRLDLFEDLRLAVRLARLREGDPSLFAGAQGLSLATRDGASVLGIDAGVLAATKLADFIRLDLDHPEYLTSLDDQASLSQLLFAASSAHVTDVFVGGECRVRNGRVVDLDPTLFERARRRARELGEGHHG